jgi:hypothetical protein
VFLSDKTGYDDRAFTLTIPPTLVSPLKIIMNVGPTKSTSDYHDTIIHELGRVWQAQHATNPTLYMSNSIKSQAMAEASNLALSVLLKKEVKAFSAYAYRPGKKFSQYAAEQIAQQAMNGETAIVAHMKAVAAGKVDPENDTGLSTSQIEDTRSPGVKVSPHLCTDMNRWRKAEGVNPLGPISRSHPNGDVGHLRGIGPPQSHPLRGPGPDAERDPAGEEQAAGTERVLAVSGLVESEPGRATIATAAYSARTGVGSGQRRAEVDHPGHRHHRAHALGPADGGAQGV